MYGHVVAGGNKFW